MKLSIPERVSIMRETMSQRAIANFFSVNVSTVRRWQYNDVVPSKNRLKTIVKKSTSIRRKLLKQARPSIAVPPETIKHKDDSYEIKPIIYSDTTHLVNGVVSNVKTFFDLAIWYRDYTNAGLFRLLLKTSGGSPEYPTALFLSTPWRKLKTKNGKASNADIADFIVNWYNRTYVDYIISMFAA